jgi:hypothetical protein
MASQFNLKLSRDTERRLAQMAHEAKVSADEIVEGILELWLKGNRPETQSDLQGFVDVVVDAVRKFGISSTKQKSGRRSSLNPQQRAEALKMRARGVSLTTIAKRFGVSKSAAFRSTTP